MAITPLSSHAWASTTNVSAAPITVSAICAIFGGMPSTRTVHESGVERIESSSMATT